MFQKVSINADIPVSVLKAYCARFGFSPKLVDDVEFSRKLAEKLVRMNIEDKMFQQNIEFHFENSDLSEFILGQISPQFIHINIAHSSLADIAIYEQGHADTYYREQQYSYSYIPAINTALVNNGDYLKLATKVPEAHQIMMVSLDDSNDVCEDESHLLNPHGYSEFIQTTELLASTAYKTYLIELRECSESGVQRIFIIGGDA